MSFEPHDFWQSFVPPGTYDVSPAEGHVGFYPAALPHPVIPHYQVSISMLKVNCRMIVTNLRLNCNKFACEVVLQAAPAL